VVNAALWLPQSYPPPIQPTTPSYQTQDLDPPAEMRRQYRELAEAVAPHVDVLLAETLSTAEEALAVAEATAGLGESLFEVLCPVAHSWWRT